MCSGQATSKNCKILKRKQLNKKICNVGRNEDPLGGGNEKFTDFEVFKAFSKV